MRISFTFGADVRETQGKGASRRLRHTGKVPAILYGAHQDAQALVLDQQNLLTMIADERFYSSIVRLKIGERTQEAIIKDVQMHPAKNVVVHVDLQRVVENEPIRIRLPIPLQGRERVARRQDPGRRGIAHARRRRGQQPAEGSAGIPGAGSFGHEPQRDQVSWRISRCPRA